MESLSERAPWAVETGRDASLTLLAACRSPKLSYSTASANVWPWTLDVTATQIVPRLEASFPCSRRRTPPTTPKIEGKANDGFNLEKVRMILGVSYIPYPTAPVSP